MEALLAMKAEIAGAQPERAQFVHLSDDAQAVYALLNPQIGAMWTEIKTLKRRLHEIETRGEAA